MPPENIKGAAGMSLTTEIGQQILQAYETGVPIEPVRSKISGVPAAYSVQSETVRIWLARGRKVAGHKIGLTSKAIQAQLGVDEPDFGTLFNDMVRKDGAEIKFGSILQPRIEGELAFVLKSDLRGSKITPEAVMEATDYVTPAVEICGSRIARWDIRIEDTIADNASAGLVVLGNSRSKLPLEQLAQVHMKLRHNGAPSVEGRGEACLGNPAIAVAWLAEAMTRFGNGLRAGDVVMSGAFAKMIPAEPGSKFEADFGDLGSVSLHFSE